MALLDGTPFLMEGASCEPLLARIKQLEKRVTVLRRDGALDSNTLDALRKEWGIHNVYESAGIEGNQLDLSETILAITRGITISGKPSEHSEEVRNLYTAHEYLEQLVQQKRIVNETDIRQIQSIIVGSKATESGAYRSVEVIISKAKHKPPMPGSVPSMMEDLVKWLTSSDGDPVLIRAAILHSWFTHIHPFRDGNGRTARAITNLLLIQHGYPVVVVRRKDRQRYYEALRASDEGDLVPILDLLVERTTDSLRQIDRIRSAITGISLTTEMIREREEQQYKVWLDGMRHWGSVVVERMTRFAESIPNATIRFQHYDLPDLQDYQYLCAGDSSGNTWFMQITISYRSTVGKVLLWFGYSSEILVKHLQLENSVPALIVSERNPTGEPPWSIPRKEFPSTAREFAYIGGAYYRVNSNGVIQESESAMVVASEFSEELIRGWFGKKEHDAVSN